MDDQRFDSLAKRLGGSRRSLLKKMVGLGGAAALARLATDETAAARRGYAGPGRSSPQTYTDQFCWLFEPRCCIECTMEPSAHDDIEVRFYGCITNHNSCAYCASHAARDYEGTCRVV